MRLPFLLRDERRFHGGIAGPLCKIVGVIQTEYSVLHNHTILRLWFGVDGFWIVPTQIVSPFEFILNFVSLYPNRLFSIMYLGTSNRASMTTLYCYFGTSASSRLR